MKNPGFHQWLPMWMLMKVIKFYNKTLKKKLKGQIQIKLEVYTILTLTFLKGPIVKQLIFICFCCCFISKVTFSWRFLRRNKSKHGKTIMFFAYINETEDTFIDNPDRQFRIVEFLEERLKIIQSILDKEEDGLASTDPGSTCSSYL